MCRVATGWKLRLQPLPLGPGQNPFFSNKPQFSSGVAPKASWGLWGPTHIINGDLLKVHGLKVFVRGTESLSSSPWAGAWLAAGAVASPGGMTCPAQGPRCFERKLGNVRRLSGPTRASSRHRLVTNTSLFFTVSGVVVQFHVQLRSRAKHANAGMGLSLVSDS